MALIGLTYSGVERVSTVSLRFLFGTGMGGADDPGDGYSPRHPAAGFELITAFTGPGPVRGGNTGWRQPHLLIGTPRSDQDLGL